MKKRLLLLVFLLLFLVNVLVTAAVILVPYKKSDGTTLKYRGTNVEVMIPKNYVEKETDFRAVWISHLVSDFPSYQSESQYKQEVQKVFDVLEYYNINAMIFHIRTHNNALYKSSLNPVASYYSRVNFDQFDPLAYIIEEAHKRGIEFHAWMNPYRLSTSFSGTVEEFAKTQPSYNIASNKDMILKAGSNLILNPGEPAVREFLIATVMEVIENYDVDAIHFDDYFYIKDVDDSKTRAKYNTENLSLGNFRRKQVDLFIEDLAKTIREYNLANNRRVQLGISPSGIYRNGSYVDLNFYDYDENGNLKYPLGSNTSGFAHYDDYLYSDTKKWIDEEWIDYILPQSYWSFEHPSAGYADVMDWWNMVVKYKNVNLYSGMGLYMAYETSNTYGWIKNENEALNQVIYGSKLENVSGHSIYSYKHLAYAYNNRNATQLKYKLFNKVKENAWKNIALLPEIRTYEKVILPKVENLKVTLENGKNVVTFDKLDGAKFYAIYRGTNTVSFKNSELIAVIGGNDDVITYTDDVNGDYVYGVKPISITNTLGEGATTKAVKTYIVEFYGLNDELLKTEYVLENTNATAPTVPESDDYLFIGWDKDFTNITNNLKVYAKFVQRYYTVRFYDKDGNLIKEEIVEYQSPASPPDAPEVEEYEFIEWDKDLSKIEENLEVYPIYKKIEVENEVFLSCKNFNFSFMILTTLLAFLVFIRRRK